MQILNMRAVPYGGPGPTVTVASFHLSLDQDLTLRNWSLRRKPDGRYIVAAPKAFGESVAFFTRPFAKQVTDAAVAAFNEAPALAQHFN